MATLQKIRNRGKILIICVGLALFAFIAEEFVRSLSYTKAESRQRVGEIYGKSINVQDYNALVDEYTDVIKFTNSLNTLNDDQVAMIRDQVWQTYVNQQLIGHEWSLRDRCRIAGHHLKGQQPHARPNSLPYSAGNLRLQRPEAVPLSVRRGHQQHRNPR